MSKLDAEVFAGDSLDIYYHVTDPDGVDVYLTGATAIYAVAKTVGDPEVIRKNSTVPGEIDLSATGDLTVHLLSSDTEGKTGNWYHEAQVTLPDSRVGTAFTGKLRVRANLCPPR